MAGHHQTLEVLFPSRARRAVLATLFAEGARPMSASALARRARLTARAVTLEVQKLGDAGLVSVEAVGPAHLVRANEEHPVARAVRRLLAAASAAGPEHAEAHEVRRSLAAHGAPLLGEEPKPTLSISETLLRGLKLARRDGTIMRVLPVVLAKHARELDFIGLRERARQLNLKAELGMLLELTADVAHLPELRKETVGLQDGRRKVPRYFPAVEGKYERRLAESRTPPAVARWGFLMNMTEDAFRSMIEKHLA